MRERKTMNWKHFRLTTRLNFKKAEVIEKIYETIALIDGVKNSWRITAHLLPQTIEQLMHSVIVTSTGSSNRIEGNRLIDQEVEDLYKNLRIQKFKTRDQQEVAGYLEVLELIFSHYQKMPLTENAILTLHADLLRHTDKDLHHKGRYKVGSNRVEAKDHLGNIVGVIFDPTPPLVKKEMQELVEWYQWADAHKIKHPLILIANFIFEYLAIHPFQDGNGRTSRLLTNLMLLQKGYLFVPVVSHERIVEAHKADYYLALNKTQKSWRTADEDVSPWILFFLKSLELQAEEALRILETDRSIELSLSDNQHALLRWATENPSKLFSRKDAIAALGLADRTTESVIKRLVELKKLQRLGIGRATRYKIII